MSTKVTIPTVGESISSGTIAIWHVKEGDVVQQQQPLFNLETDKITTEVVAETAGQIHLQAKAGDEVAIGAVVALIDESVALPQAERLETTPSPKEAVTEALAKVSTPVPSEQAGNPTTALLRETPVVLPSRDARTTCKRMTLLRKRIAQRLVAAQQQTAHLTTFNDVDMSAIMKLRKAYRDTFEAKYGVKLGLMSFFVKAVVQALQAVPNVNTQLEDDYLIQNHYYDIGIAIGTDKGLVVPILRDCETLSFAAIERKILDYVQRARDGKLKLEELEGGIFTITNGGIYGSLLSTPILNFPQSAILGMHTIKDRPVVVDGQVVVRPMMYLALSYDHRAIDGREAVTFLVKIKASLEDPSILLFAG